VCYLEGFVQDDPMASLAEAVPKLNILNRGPRELLLVETTHLVEHRTADCAAPSPKGRSLRVAVLMHEVVEKVPILRDYTFGPGDGIIRAENGGHIRMLLERFSYAPYCFWSDDNVRVHEEQDVALGVASPVVAHGGRTRVLRELENAHAHPTGDGRCVIRGGIVHDDYFRMRNA
jgi:hypothetical protein